MPKVVGLNPKPGGRSGLLQDQRLPVAQKLGDIVLFARFCFQPDEQCSLGHLGPLVYKQNVFHTENGFIFVRNGVSS
jgi:hypothetical protein